MDKNQALETLLTKVTRPVDLGEMRDDFSGTIWNCWVNPPRVIELVNTQDHDGLGGERKIVSILFDVPLDQVSQLDDAAMLWLFSKGMELYWAYHEELKKKPTSSPAGSTPISTPPATPTP